MDMTYIACLLKDGFGFKESAELQVSEAALYNTINSVCELAYNDAAGELGTKQQFLEHKNQLFIFKVV